MTKTFDFSSGTYDVVNADGDMIGVIDHEAFVRKGRQCLYRIDGDEVYSVDGKPLGYVVQGVVHNFQGETLFSIRPHVG